MTRFSRDIAKWVAIWNDAGPELDEINRRDIRRADTYTSMLALSDAFEAAMSSKPKRPISGLVEQQSYFSLLKKK